MEQQKCAFTEKIAKWKKIARKVPKFEQTAKPLSPVIECY
jgi:hypothetical protein